MATSPNKPTGTKQAVVVIHGMGEQRPMETMRQFVETVWTSDASFDSDDADDNKEARTWITPDVGVGNTELMRITTAYHECNLPNSDSNNPKARTDFFEFYWADVLAHSRLSMLTPWFLNLFFRLPNRVPVSVIGLWIMLWLIMFVMVAGFGQAIYAAIYNWDTREISWANFVLYSGRALVNFLAQDAVILTASLAALLSAAAIMMSAFWHGKLENSLKPNLPNRVVFALKLLIITLLVLAAVKFMNNYDSTFTNNTGTGRGLYLTLPVNVFFSLLVLYLLNTFIVPYFGDVARYLYTSPNTVGKREEIRKRGLELLRRLHNDKQYARIIVVSHSLGTVIAYDLLRILWSEYGPVSANGPLNEEQIEKFQEVARVAGNIENTDNLIEFRQAQKAAFVSLQKKHSRTADPAEHKQWKISDLVTVGSPLNHARFLMASSQDHLDKLIAERTLPVCPPLLETGKNRYQGSKHEEIPTYLYEVGPDGNKTCYAHHATPFAVVRWSNIFDWRILALFGDFVSGPLRQLFGNGIADYHVRLYHGLASWFTRYVTHTLYWQNKDVSSHAAGTPANNKINNVPYHVALLRSLVDMRFTDDPLTEYQLAKPFSFPVATLLRHVVWIILAVAAVSILLVAGEILYPGIGFFTLIFG